MKNQIQAIVLADSISERENRITTQMVTFPRYILAELNTHRMFSRNSASSRAIPFHKTVESVIKNPFIPFAFQKDHAGMQGTEYLDTNKKYLFSDIQNILHENLKKAFFNEKTEEWLPEYAVVDYAFNNHINEILYNSTPEGLTIREWWLKARDLSVACAYMLNAMGVTKQLCNRIIEPFMWHTVLITATEWDNFFELRCPQYENAFGELYKSKREYTRSTGDPDMIPKTKLGWLMLNQGQADIHMMELAEAMWDARNESQPKYLLPGEWHIPFGDQIDKEKVIQTFNVTGFDTGDVADVVEHLSLQIATARCARVSYTVVGEEAKTVDYKKDIELHDRLLYSGHFSPFEHCARTMRDTEYSEYLRGHGNVEREDFDGFGWCLNFRGFIQYRLMIDK